MLSKLLAITMTMGVLSTPHLPEVPQDTTDLTLAGMNQGPAIVGEVIRVSEHGTFVLTGSRYAHRLWGVEADAAFLKDYLLGRRLVCKVLGTYERGRSTIDKSIFSITAIVDCRFGDGGNTYKRELLTDRKSISEYLVTKGHLRELCFETINAFKTCK